MPTTDPRACLQLLAMLVGSSNSRLLCASVCYCLFLAMPLPGYAVYGSVFFYAAAIAISVFRK